MESEQQHLFDPGPYTRPATHAEPLVQAQDTRTPAQRKRDVNRERIAGTSFGNRARYGEDLGDIAAPRPTMTRMEEDYGFPFRAAAPHLAKLTPFDDTAWRKFGRTIEMPLVGNGTIDEGGFGTGQDSVVQERVDEIAANPSLGSDPRFPGGDLPLVADIGFRRNGRTVYAPVLHNGNHRVAGAIQRGEMFTPVNYIDRAQLPEAAAHARARRADYGDPSGLYGNVRGLKDQLGAIRMRQKDATAHGGSRHPLWTNLPWK